MGSLAAQYRKSLEKHWGVRFKSRHPDGDNYDGIVVHNARTFIVLAEEQSFEFDGFVAMPKASIRGYRDTGIEACMNRIIRQNGELRRLKVPAWLTRCATIIELMETLKKRGIWPAIKTLFPDGSSALYLGPLESISKEGFRIGCYDAAGQWETTYPLRWSELFRVEFNSRYCEHFNRYMRSGL